MHPKQVFWIGAKGGLCEEKHRRRMGEAVWLFLWLLMRQTGVNDAGEGMVLYGKTVRLLDIANDTGFPIGTLHRWSELLAQQDYIRIEVEPRVGSIYYILNAKRKSSGKLTRSRKNGESDVSNNGNEKGQFDSSPGNVNSISGNEIESKSQKTKASSSKATTLIPKSLSYSNKAAAATAAAVPSPSVEQVAREKQIPRAGISDAEARDRAQKQKQDLAEWLKKHPEVANANPV
jgi:hypothetical protein